MHTFMAKVKSFIANLVLWQVFIGGLVLSGAAKQIFDDTTQQNIATYGGGALALIAGSKIAKKPKIKAFLSRPGTLWFLFLVNGSAAAGMYFALDGIDRYIGSGMMGLVSLGALGGLIASRRKPAAGGAHRADPAARHAEPEGPWA
ncbi:hypothetical protein OK074_6264 [Actinobacteria bacterium OK074]|nr:hypothetical protein OK074_6264 [Actinobacteria bacterium OK074]